MDQTTSDTVLDGEFDTTDRTRITAQAMDVEGASNRLSEFRWHPVKGQPVVMQQVPKSQRTSGSEFQPVLHPQSCGGYADWGKTW